MNMVCIGKIVNTHGIKGELRIISSFQQKDIVFQKNNILYIGKEKYKEVIQTYRKHKDFDMVTFQNYDNINQVLKYKNQKVYVDREDYQFTDYLDEDLIGLEVYMNGVYIGLVKEIEKIQNNPLLVIANNEKINYIPNRKEFVESIDFQTKKLYIKYIEGLVT